MNKIFKKLKDKGVKGTFVSITSRFYSKNYLMKIKISSFDTKKTNCKVEEINEEISKYLKYNLDEFNDSKYNQFIEKIAENKDTGYVIYHGDKVAGYLWAMSGEIEEGLTGYKDDLLENEIYIYDMYIFEEFRKLGLGYNFVSSILNMASNNYDYAHVIVDGVNYKSRGLFQKLGFKDYGKIYTFKKKKKKYRKVVIKNGN